MTTFQHFKYISKHFSILAFLFLFGQMVSTSSLADEVKNPPKFKVEIVVFETLALRGWTEEFWPSNPDIIDTETAVNVDGLPETESMLSEQVEKMTPALGYKVLYHKTWLLNAVPEDEALPLLISVIPEKEGQPRVEGTLLFYKSRYPHVIVNLELERKIPLRIRKKFALHQKMELDQLPEYWRFQIHESRKIKSNQLHYIDHPLFGALVQIQYQPDK